MSNIKTLPEKIIVGIRDYDKTGYMFHHDTAPSKNKKSEQSILKWDDTAKIEILDNEFLTGFKVVGVKSRQSTSNKLMVVEDPRGFSLQIYMKDFLNMIKDLTIVKGDIKEKCCWVRDSGSPVLVVEDGDIHKNLITKTENKNKENELFVDLSKLQVGDVFTAVYLNQDGSLHKRGSYVYRGVFNIEGLYQATAGIHWQSPEASFYVEKVHVYQRLEKISGAGHTTFFRKGNKLGGFVIDPDRKIKQESLPKLKAPRIWEVRTNQLNFLSGSLQRKSALEPVESTFKFTEC